MLARKGGFPFRFATTPPIKGSVPRICAHRRIDPFGLAFESFDALGAWRETVQAGDTQQSLEPSLKPADGPIINSSDDLKAYILTQRLEAFSQGFVESLMQYAVGRHLDLADDESVDRAHQAFVDTNYDFKMLVQAVVASDSFRGASH